MSAVLPVRINGYSGHGSHLRWTRERGVSERRNEGESKRSEGGRLAAGKEEEEGSGGRGPVGAGWAWRVPGAPAGLTRGPNASLEAGDRARRLPANLPARRRAAVHLGETSPRDDNVSERTARAAAGRAKQTPPPSQSHQ